MEDLTVQDLIEDQEKIHTVSINDNLKTVLEVLYKYNIHSVPVINAESDCAGWIDLGDIVSFLLKTSHTTKESGTTPPSNSLKDDDLEMLLERSNDFKLATAMEALAGQNSSTDRVSANQPLLPVTKGAPVAALFQNFAVGVSRIPVVENDNQKLITGIITQTQVNLAIAKKPELLGDAGKKSLKELGLVKGADKMVIVQESVPTVDAFEVMNRHGLKNVGVVSDSGALKGCVSATDLKLVKDFNFRMLLKTVRDFVSSVRASEELSKNYLVFCDEDTSLMDAIKKLADFKVHRVFIVDKKMKPVGVLSLTDYAKVIADKYKWKYG